MHTPAYLDLLNSGGFSSRVRLAQQMLEACMCCGCLCKIDRTKGTLGVCRTGVQARISSFGPHHGEESPLSGWRGSGTIFFSRCNLHCQFCQNHDISQTDAGDLVTSAELAEIMLALQSLGCHNINVVSPTHVIVPIIEAVFIASQKGLHLPIVYNTGGYDSQQALQLLDGIIDIYLPDMKYRNPQTAQRYSKIYQYPQVNSAAVRAMHEQVGDLLVDDQGIARRGLLIRHLVLPKGLAGTSELVRFVAQEISPNTYINIMDQYHPAFHSREFPSLNRRVTSQEIHEAMEQARQAGLHRFAH